MPSPVLKEEPRNFARSQLGPKYRALFSELAPKPPEARTTDLVVICSGLPFESMNSIPVTFFPASPSNFMALLS